jgi:hypothetical protein
MSTPFIWFHTRGLTSAAGQSVFLIVATILIWALGGAILVGEGMKNVLPGHVPLIPTWLWRTLIVCIEWIVGFAAFALFSAPVRPFMTIDEKLPSFLSKAERHSSSSIMSKLNSVLIVQPPADEAWLGLAIPALAMWFNRGLGWLLSRVWKAVFIGFALGLLIFGLLFLSFFGMQKFGGDALIEGLSGPWLQKVAITSAWLVAAAFIEGLVWICLAVLGGLTLWLLGYKFTEGVALTISSEVHVEHYPAGSRWAIFCPAERIEGLHHSVYESREVQSEVAKWLREKWPSMKDSGRNDERTSTML